MWQLITSIFIQHTKKCSLCVCVCECGERCIKDMRAKLCAQIITTQLWVERKRGQGSIMAVVVVVVEVVSANGTCQNTEKALMRTSIFRRLTSANSRMYVVYFQAVHSECGKLSQTCGYIIHQNVAALRGRRLIYLCV